MALRNLRCGSCRTSPATIAFIPTYPKLSTTHFLAGDGVASIASQVEQGFLHGIVKPQHTRPAVEIQTSNRVAAGAASVQLRLKARHHAGHSRFAASGGGCPPEPLRQTQDTFASMRACNCFRSRVTRQNSTRSKQKQISYGVQRESRSDAAVIAAKPNPA